MSAWIHFRKFRSCCLYFVHVNHLTLSAPIKVQRKLHQESKLVKYELRIAKSFKRIGFVSRQRKFQYFLDFTNLLRNLSYCLHFVLSGSRQSNQVLSRNVVRINRINKTKCILIFLRTNPLQKRNISQEEVYILRLAMKTNLRKTNPWTGVVKSLMKIWLKT